MMVQRVLTAEDGPESWTVVNECFSVIEPIEHFLAHQARIERASSTVRSYAFDLRDFFWFLTTRGSDWTVVDPETIGAFIAWLRLPPSSRSSNVVPLRLDEPHCSTSTINRKLAAVGSFYRYHSHFGVDSYSITTARRRSSRYTPFLGHLAAPIKQTLGVKLKPPQRHSRTLTRGQIDEIICSCDRLRDRLLISLLHTSGIRIGEAIGLRHEDIDPASMTLHVRSRVNANGARAKTGEREIPIPAHLIRLYTDYLVDEYGDIDSDYVFVNLWSGRVGEPWKYWTVTDLTSRLRRRSGVVFTPHMLRHTYATDLLRRGVPQEIVQKLLGHRSITTTIDTYAHLAVDDVRRALTKAGWLTDNAITVTAVPYAIGSF